MTKKQLVVEIIYTTIIRGVLTFMLVFLCFGAGYLNRWLMPFGLTVALCLMGLYIYSVIDEVRLFIEAYHDAEK